MDLLIAKVPAVCGIELADDHHNIAITSSDGTVLSTKRISDDAGGLRALLELRASCGDCAENPIPIAIETSRGLLGGGVIVRIPEDLEALVIWRARPAQDRCFAVLVLRISGGVVEYQRENVEASG